MLGKRNALLNTHYYLIFTLDILLHTAQSRYLNPKLENEISVFARTLLQGERVYELLPLLFAYTRRLRYYIYIHL